jgi:hypothetical protein
MSIFPLVREVHYFQAYTVLNGRGLGDKGYELSGHYTSDLYVFRRKALDTRANRDSASLNLVR